MAEPGDEHGVIDGLGDGIAPPGEQSSSNRAPVSIKHVADAPIDRIAQALHERRVAQRQPAAVGRIGRLDRPHHEAGGADALEKHVAAEIVTARPRRRHRRQQPRLQFDKAADRWRRPLLHRQPHALQLDLIARAIHRDDAQDETIGTLADVPRLDKARQRRRIDRFCEDGMSDARGFPGRDGKTCGRSREHHGNGKHLVPAQQDGRRAKSDRDDRRNGEHGLMVRGKIEGDPGAESDRHPRQQPPGTGLRPGPAAQRLDQRRPRPEIGRRVTAGVSRSRRRRPGPRIAPSAARRFTLLGHASASCDPVASTRLPEGEMCGNRNGWRKRRRTGVGFCYRT
ncbi:hypothetical protein ES707_18092 [subsurface metagenome]